VYLPASDKNVAELAPAEVEEAAIRGRVLVMDDEEMIRDVAGEMLKLLGYEVVFACNGEEAVRNYKAALSSGKLFDAVIVDLTVPGGKGGRETVKMLQGLDPAVKAIVSSGYSNDPIMADFKKYGFSGIVVKPYRLAELREAMNRLLNKC
jgi:two-component system cell cycle sensor histidine kinase/response regulator CckA